MESSPGPDWCWPLRCLGCQAWRLTQQLHYATIPYMAAHLRCSLLSVHVEIDGHLVAMHHCFMP